jgi:hypothetical protein
MLYQHLLDELKKRNMTESAHNETQNASTTNGSKSRRITASMFFKKSLKQEESSKADETIQRLQEENRKLRQELNDANSRIHELESAARETEFRQQREISPLSPAPTLVRSATAPLYTNTREGVEDRDDDGRGETIDDDSYDGFSVEVEAATAGFEMEVEELLQIEETDETDSTTGSACTIPTANDKKSNSNRKLRQRMKRSSSNRRSGEDAYLNYFSRRSPPLESITEIDTRRNSSPHDNNDYCDYGDDLTTTSDLTASVAGDELSIDGGSLMSGRRLPLYAMKSLLRISSAESSQSHAISFVPDDEPVLFGEI